jgi:hypothetical protein
MISTQVVVYSLTFALLFRDHHRGDGFLMNILDDAASWKNKVRERWRQPQDLFTQIGQPVFPAGPCDFLIGWQPTFAHFGLIFDPFSEQEPNEQYRGVTPSFCPDPCRCAGVLSRCVCTLYLSRRVPDFSWETLLARPVAFDEPLIFPA